MRDLTDFNKHLQIFQEDTLDHLNNDEYKTHKSEENYTLLITLYRVLPKDTLRKIITYISAPINLSNRTIRRLSNSVKTGSYNDFKYIFDNEYILDPKIQNYFEFDEYSVSPAAEWRMYELCNCRTCCKGTKYCTNCTPTRLRKYYSVKTCHCENGKRYIAYKMIENYIQDSTTTSAEFYAKTNAEKLSSIDNAYNQAKLTKMIIHVVTSGPIDTDYNPTIDSDSEMEFE